VVAVTTIAYLVACYSDNILDYLTFDWCYWVFFGLIFAQLFRYQARVSGHRKTYHWQSRTRDKRSRDIAREWPQAIAEPAARHTVTNMWIFDERSPLGVCVGSVWYRLHG
jgi:hypothetical protein